MKPRGYALIVLGLLLALCIENTYTPVHASSAAASAAASASASAKNRASNEVFNEEAVMEELEEVVSENLTESKERKEVIQTEMSGWTISDYSELRMSLLEKETLTDVEKVTLEVAEDYISESSTIQGVIIALGGMSTQEQLLLLFLMIGGLVMFALALFGALGAF